MVPNAAASTSVPGSRDRVGPGDRLGPDGRYELLVRIGSGGMGSVYRARDHKLGCDRAVKVLDSRYAAIPAFVERFRREAMAATRIAHPNIVAVLEVADADERPVYLVMELLEGKTLSQMVRGSGRLPWAQVRHYIDQIAAGLGAAHAREVVHRDVKPGNCLVLPDDQVKVLDFGIAKVTDMPPEVAALTAAGEIIGTCSYMAPEQIRGQVDKRSDIYALGVLTFRMLTGKVPFEHREQDKVLLAHLTEPPPAPSSLVQGLPPAVDDFVLRMLAKQPHKRFDGMEELRRVLGGIERGVPVAIDDPTAVPPSGGPSPTAMFEEAPTRAVMRDASPATDTRAGAVRRTINTAPAGSGTLTQLEAERLAGRAGDPAGETRPDGPAKVGPAGTVALDGAAALGAGPVGTVALPDVVGVAAGPVGTVVLEDPRAPASGGTAVVEGQPMAAGWAPGPTPTPTQVAPPIRPLGGLPSTSEAPPRVTRMAVPPDEPSSGVMRAVVAAFGGIGLAAAVVVGFVLWQRNASSDEAPAAAPAAAAVVDEVPAGPDPVVEVETLPAEADGAAGSTKTEAAALVQASEPVETEAKADATTDARAGANEGRDPTEPPQTSPDARPPKDRTEGETKTKKRKVPKGKSGKDSTSGSSDSSTSSEPEPKPDPGETKSGRRKGDLRDPF